MSRLNRAQRAMLRRPRAAREARERELADPFEQARLRVAEGTHAGRCQRAIDAIAERHRKLGNGLREKPVIMAYGNRGDRRRLDAAARAREKGQPEPGPDLAAMMGCSRRTAQRAIADLEAAGELVIERGRGVVERRGRADRHGQHRMHTVGRGGAGWANAYYVRGIPPPAPPTSPPPPQVPEPDPEPPPRPRRWQEVRDQFERDRTARLRGKVTRGP